MAGGSVWTDEETRDFDLAVALLRNAEGYQLALERAETDPIKLAALKTQWDEIPSEVALMAGDRGRWVETQHRLKELIPVLKSRVEQV